MELFPVLWLACFLLAGKATGVSAGYELETECNPPAASNAPTPAATFSFRVDRLTTDECNAYVALIKPEGACNPPIIPQCNTTTNDEFLFQPTSKTYLDVGCSANDRAAMVQLTKNIPTLAANRATKIELQERNDTTDPVHTDVIEPIRNQLIHLSIRNCVTNSATAKVYDLGNLPFVLRFDMQSCWGLVVKKRDFERMPQVRMMRFLGSTIESMEPYTFTNLGYLRSLVIEEHIAYFMEQKTDGLKHNLPAGNFIADADVERVRKLHCDCSFAWLRNFLKKNPSLIAEKVKGQAYILGNFLSAAVWIRDSYQSVLSVDCGKNFTQDNVRAGTQFSYNTACYKVRC
ncbi:uncharacterized protein LOC129599928 isoform X1 [Paramacrobiotus metropolitanus]|uniref:uncharacterized protein LOC129599928 isoform X1 n=1 Tax=Paramacrobiotus metropolitanus TaxID=2943436 RepID=UPI002446255A|nr:uncharacterized protein LOC129599928 isoform X1 [Paramacrobiotus metropolitanus]XP_055354270.1 uncharacterized protein LOC129599928 isoform X1 [Paramacrobiotus metropolitanus]